MKEKTKNKERKQKEETIRTSRRVRKSGHGLRTRRRGSSIYGLTVK
jgi:hypothetical protein